MKDPSDEILTAFYTALNGNLSYGGSNFPVYTVAPKSEYYRYVFLTELDVTDDSTKDKFTTDCTLIFEIVDKVYKKRSTYKAVNSIANSILLLVIRQSLTMTNFDMTVKPWLFRPMEIFLDPVDLGVLPRKTIPINFKVQQK